MRQMTLPVSIAILMFFSLFCHVRYKLKILLFCCSSICNGTIEIGFNEMGLHEVAVKKFDAETYMTMPMQYVLVITTWSVHRLSKVAILWSDKLSIGEGLKMQ